FFLNNTNPNPFEEFPIEIFYESQLTYSGQSASILFSLVFEDGLKQPVTGNSTLLSGVASNITIVTVRQVEDNLEAIAVGNGEVTINLEYRFCPLGTPL
uniref:hypothetical protein n=1 Tax=Salmonella sp. s51228 TaxID=3159652 RepID=UPI00397F15C1